MARFDYDYSCSTKCGSGTSCSYTIKKDAIVVLTGTTQVPSNQCTDTGKRDWIVSKYPYANDDTAYANGIQFYPAKSDMNVAIMIGLAIGLGYLLLRKE